QQIAGMGLIISSLIIMSLRRSYKRLSRAQKL
ncbi:MAG TPA: EamA family transporter, partial [Thermotoga sp.]|nr:EamA family transporter [Thermotoga sp.]